MVWAKKWSASWALALLGFGTSFVGCSGESSSNSCIAYCDNLCASFESCELSSGEEDCRSTCQGGLADGECRNQPAPDRLTCDELTKVVTCAEYCGTLCERAPECGTFDSKACVTGCASAIHSICNAASVAARTCDQLKPEIRLYERLAAPGDGDGSASGGSFSSFGLCKEADECEEPLGCSRATNTCAACEANADCARDYGAYICNDAQECEKVACVADEDCILGRPCNTETHECGECREDADCTSSSRSACDTKTLLCVECNEDADCAGKLFVASCDVDRKKCVECGKDEDCNGTTDKVCDLESRSCVGCVTDRDCKDSFTPACSALLHSCVQCNDDADCPEDTSCEVDIGLCYPD